MKQLLNTNQSFTDTLEMGNVLNISTTNGNSLIILTSPSGVVSKSSTTGPISLGPFNAQQTYSVTCISGVTTVEETCSDQLQLVGANTNPLTGVSTISVAGTSQGAMLSRTVNNSVILFGDSITAQGGGPIPEFSSAPTDFTAFASGTHYFNLTDNTFYTSNGSAWSATLTGENAVDGYSNTSWWQFAAMTQFGKFNVVSNAGIIGQNTTQILARLQADVLAKSPAWVCLLAGANDPSSSTPLATSIANIGSMVSQCLAAGIKVIISTVWPNSVIASAPDRLEWLDNINTYIKSLDVNPNVFVVDGFAAISSGNNTYPGTTILYDGTHSAPQGAMQKGLALAPILARTASPSLSQPDYSTNSTHNYAYNGSAFSTAGGGNANGVNGFSLGGVITGVGPDGWAVGTLGTWGTDTVVSSVAASTDGKGGNWAVFTVSAVGGSTDGHSFYIQAQPVSLAAIARSSTYTLGQSRTLAGSRYVAVAVSGNTAASAPGFNAVIGSTTVDGGVTWKCVDMISAGDRLAFGYEFEIGGNFLTSGGLFLAGYQSITASGSLIMTSGGSYSKTGFPTVHPKSGLWASPSARMAANLSSLQCTARCYLAAGASGVVKIRALSHRKI